MALKTRAALKVDNDNVLTTNANQEITGAAHNDHVENILDSCWNKTDEAYLASQIYNTTRSYVIGDMISVSGRTLVANVANSGAYDPTEWDDPKNSQTLSPAIVSIAGASNVDLANSEATTILLTGASTTVNTITNGVHGRVYRFYAVDGSTMTFTNTTPANVISNGTGQIALVGAPIVIVGRVNHEVSDFIDLRCYNRGGKEGWGLENSKVLS